MKKDSTLLIIDDEVDICLLLERILNKYFKTVVCCHTLTAASEHIRQNEPTHILLDNNLPDGYGLDYVTTIKKVVPNIIVVIISALDLKPLAMSMGADSFVSKPLNMLLVKQALSLV